MLTAHYIGDHASDTLAVRLGWWLTRLVQKGPYGNVTHTEAIHAEHDDGSVTIASASVRDGGVRSKRVTLNPAHWIVIDVPQWAVVESCALLKRTEGWPYDWRGALALFLPGSQDDTASFCNEWVGTPFLKASGTFSPSQFSAICLSIGVDVTAKFFAERKHTT